MIIEHVPVSGRIEKSPMEPFYDFLQCGQDVFIYPQAKIVAPEVIMIGDSVKIDDFSFIVGGLKTMIGSFVHIASFASVTGGGEFIMDDFSAISSGVRVFTGNEDYSGATMTNPAVPARYRTPTRGTVHIEKHAIVGANSVILPGVTIGEGAVIAPNSTITQSCAPWRLYAGNPLRAVTLRPSETILALEQQLRAELYTPDGHYIPAHLRTPVGE
jgi:acetyltransferase-like isoleucine patch superfamily enzyme